MERSGPLPLRERIARQIGALGSYVAWRGLAGAVLFPLYLLRTRLARRPYAVSDPALGRIWLRPRTTDLHVFRQVVVRREYAADAAHAAQLDRRIDAARAQGRVPLILDGGGNIGLFARWAAARFPQARVICVEPDPGNLALARRNCAGLAAVAFVQAALWSERTQVHFADSGAEAWALSVEAGGGGIAALSIDDVLADHPDGDLVLLKLDIEGAERQALAPGAAFWGRRPVIYIEPHDGFPGRAASLSGLLAQSAYHDADVLVNGENLLVFPAAAPRA